MKKFALLSLIISSSCSAPFYFPNSHNSPMFTKSGELQATACVVNGFEIQSAYSISKHIGLIANYSYASPRGVSEAFNAGENYHQKFFEGGLGYFHNESTMLYEFFAGYGRGENSNTNLSGKYERYFLQPAIGTHDKILQISFAPRISIVNFLELDGSDLENFDHKAKVIFEPAVIIRGNILHNHAYFTFQVGTAKPLSNNVFFKVNPVQLSTGFGFRIGGVKE